MSDSVHKISIGILETYLIKLLFLFYVGVVYVYLCLYVMNWKYFIIIKQILWNFHEHDLKYCENCKLSKICKSSGVKNNTLRYSFAF